MSIPKHVNHLVSVHLVGELRFSHVGIRWMVACRGRAHTRHFQKLEKDKQPPPPVLFGKHAHKLALVQDSGVVGTRVSECQDATAHNGVAAAFAGKFDVVVDATGSPAGLSLAAGLCRPMGTLVLKSTCAAGSEQFNAAPFVIDELRVVGSRCGPIDEALQLLAIPAKVDDTNGNTLPPLNVEKYITKTFPLAQANQAIQCAAEKSTMKVCMREKKGCSGTKSHVLFFSSFEGANHLQRIIER